MVPRRGRPAADRPAAAGARRRPERREGRPGTGEGRGRPRLRRYRLGRLPGARGRSLCHGAADPAGQGRRPHPRALSPPGRAGGPGL
ncbi:hypothetical protein AZA_87588 [Nitrospirillum viridazoti Y2]|nr:hypothetical protein AZA_87588 [Nitrospirillum amazonense Y2]